MTAKRRASRWPLYLIGSSAAVAVFTGWVGLGGMTGFGVVHPLPGIWDSFHLNTAITLPIGVEAYGAYALGAWIDPSTPKVARKFAKRSALGSLFLGMLGQVAFHLLAAAHRVFAPWEIVTAVSCLPVLTLGLAAGLHHLRHVLDDEDPGLIVQGPEPTPGELNQLQKDLADMTPGTVQRLMDPVIKEWATSGNVMPTATTPAPWDDPAWMQPPQTVPDPSIETSLNPVLGSVNVRSPLSRADRKIPGDERAAARMTGSFPVVTE